MKNKAQKLLESLTPGGSEFVDDPEYCVKFLKEFMEDQHSIIVKKIREKNELIEQKNELLEALKQAKDIMTTYNLMNSKAGAYVDAAIKKAIE